MNAYGRGAPSDSMIARSVSRETAKGMFLMTIAVGITSSSGVGIIPRHWAGRCGIEGTCCEWCDANGAKAAEPGAMPYGTEGGGDGASPIEGNGSMLNAG